MRRDDERLAHIIEAVERIFVRTPRADGRAGTSWPPLPPTITRKVCQRDYVGVVTSDGNSLAYSG